MDNNVIWKPIPNYEGYYEVSSNGEIRSVERIVGGIGERKLHGKPVKLRISCSGYLQVGLCKDGKTKSCKIHKIVASVFVPNPENKPCIDHINTNRTDNRACNLRWVTLKENSNNPLTKKHSKYGRGTAVGERRKRCQRFGDSAPNHPKPVYRYTLNGTYIDGFQSLIEAEIVTGIEFSGIKKALDKIHRTAGGYLWTTTKVDRYVPYKRRRHTKCKTLQMIDSDGVVLKEWVAVRDAAKGLGTTHTRILRYMAEGKPMDGYYFKYK